MSEEQREELSRSELIESSEKPLLASREIPDRPQVDSIAFTPEELVQVQQEEVVRVSLSLRTSREDVVILTERASLPKYYPCHEEWRKCYSITLSGDLIK
jgi:hypothetical protein